MSKSNEIIIWLDLETTGLDPEADQILEIAATATSVEDGELTDEHFSQVVRIEPGALEKVYKTERVHGMHESNGLLAETVGRDAVWLRDALRALDAWLAPRCRDRWVLLGGYSVHFDLGFLRAAEKRCLRYESFEAFPTRHFSHQIVDSSAIDRLFKTAGLDTPKPKGDDVAHRALADARAAAKTYRTALRILRNAKPLISIGSARGDASKGEQVDVDLGVVEVPTLQGGTVVMRNGKIDLATTGADQVNETVAKHLHTIEALREQIEEREATIAIFRGRVADLVASKNQQKSVIERLMVEDDPDAWKLDAIGETIDAFDAGVSGFPHGAESAVEAIRKLVRPERSETNVSVPEPRPEVDVPAPSVEVRADGDTPDGGW